MNLENIAKHQETVLTEIRKNESQLLVYQSMDLDEIVQLWEKQHKLTNVMMWLQNVAKAVQEQEEKESRIIKPINGLKLAP